MSFNVWSRSPIAAAMLALAFAANAAHATHAPSEANAVSAAHGAMPATKSVTMLAQPLTANAATPSAKPAAKPAAAPAKPARTETATFAMGCFWCGESQFEKQPGVKSVVSGYTGGPEENPTYKQVSSGYTGHYEAVQIVYDPTLTSYEKLLDMFWHGIDPTQADGQFCDLGPQYRSAVFTHDAAQRKQAEDSRKALEASKVLKKPIVTQILASSRFWPAEEYHQDFCFNSAERYNSYRQGCGRDRRLAELWGDKAAKPLAH